MTIYSPIVSGSLTVSGSTVLSGSLTVTQGITGSLAGTASNAVSSSYASTAFYVTNAQTASYVVNAVSSSYTVTASYAQTASYVNVLNQNVTITGSLNITGSTYQIGNNTLYGTTLLSGSITISGSTTSPTTPSIKVYGDMETNGVIKFDPVIKSIDTSISASYIYVSGSTQDLYFTQNGQGYSNTTRLRWLESVLYTGILNGGVLTSTPGSTTFTITSGSGLIVTLNASTSSNPYPTVKQITWNTQTLPITYSGSAKITYVGIDNTGAVIQQTNTWGSLDINQWDNSIAIGVVLTLSGSVSTGVFNSPQISYGPAQKTDDFFRAFGPLKLSGHTLIASGSTMSIVKSAGSSYREGANYAINPNHPSTVIENSSNTSKIYRYYLSGSTPVIDTGAGSAGYTVIDPTKYVNTSGQLATVPTNGSNLRYTIQRVFWIPNSPTNAFIVYYGSTLYASLIDAQNGIGIEPFTEAPNTAVNAIQIGYIIVAGNATDLTNASQASIVQAGLFRNVGGIGSSGTNFVSATLAGLADVSITSPTDGQPFVYSTAQAKWLNQSSITASLYGTASNATSASYATTASYILNAVSSSYAATASYYGGSVVSSSYASTASLAPNYVLNSATSSMLSPYVLTSVTSSMTVATASYVQTAQTASYYVEKDPVFTAISASLATTGSNIFNGNQTISGSIFIGTSTNSGYKLDVSGSGRIQNNFGVGTLSAPGIITATPSGSGGTLTTGTYYYTLVAVDGLGNTTTTGSQASASVVSTGGTGSVALTWTAVPGVYSYRIYQGTTTAQTQYLTSSITSATDVGSGYTTGSTLPTINTTVMNYIGTGSINNFNGVNLGYGAGGINSNVVLGYNTFGSNTTGTGNVAVGYYALAANTTNSNQVAIGNNALRYKTGASNTVAIGNLALGGNNVAGGGNSIAIGSQVLQNATSAYNIGIGGGNFGAPGSPITLYALTSGGGNVAIGNNALSYITTTGNNTALGANAGTYYGTYNDATRITGATNGIYIGSGVLGGAASPSNEIVIGVNAVGNGSNTTVIGTTSTVYSKVFGNFGAGTLSAPGIITITPSGSGGTLATNTYYYTLVAVDGLGNTTVPGSQASASVTGPTGSVALTWTAVPGAYSYRIYQGTTTAQTQYLTSSTTTATDIGSGYITGSSLPILNTTSFNYIGSGSTNYLASNLSLGTLSSGANITNPIGSYLQFASNGGVSLYATNNQNLSIGAAGSGYVSITAGSGLITNNITYPNNQLQIGPGAGQRLVFVSNGAEQMRLSSLGNLLIGTTTDSGYKLDVSGSSRIVSSTVNTSSLLIVPPPQNTSGVAIWVSGSNTKGGSNYVDFIQITNTATGATNPNKFFRVDNSGSFQIISNNYATQSLSLTDGGTLTTAGGGTSDVRTKNNVCYITGSVYDTISQLKPAAFEYNIYPGVVRHGFIAQDVLTVDSDLVLGNGSEEGGTYGLDYNGILALTVKALQEATTRIEQLELQVTALLKT